MSQEITLSYRAIFEKAKQKEEIEAVENNFFVLFHLNSTCYELRRLLNTNLVSLDKKLLIFNELPCFVPSVVFSDVLQLILTHRLHPKLQSIYEGFLKQIEEKMGRLIVQVHSPIPLTLSVQKNLKNELHRILNKAIQLKIFLDETLVGGIIIKLPDGTIYDFSYNKILSDLKYYLTENN